MDKKTLRKYQHPRWQKLRLQILDREKFTCQACGRKDETLHVHHLMYYSGAPWETPSKYLECLCKACHGARTEADSIAISRIRLRPTRDVISEDDRNDFLEMIGEL